MISDFADDIEEKIEEALEEGADPVAIASVLVFVMGQILLDYQPVEVVVQDMLTIVEETGGVLEQVEAQRETLH